MKDSMKECSHVMKFFSQNYLLYNSLLINNFGPNFGLQNFVTCQHPLLHFDIMRQKSRWYISNQ